MERVLADLNWTNCFVYLDDILVCSKNVDEHVQQLQQIFDRLTKAGLTLKLKKCDFALDRVLYLGHVIDQDGLRVNPLKIAALKELPPPTTVTELKSFIGLANYYRRFVREFAAKTKALNRLLVKGEEFKWTADCQQNFEQIKRDLENSAVLAFPDFTKPFVVHTDACGYGIGGVLAQGTDPERAIAFVSRTLNKAEKNYSTIEKEALAIVWSIKQFRPYVYGHKFTLYTDHAPIRLLKITDGASSRLVRWTLSLQEYDCDIQYRKGSENANADALSRLPRPTTDPRVVNVNAIPDNNRAWEEAQRNDAFLGPIYHNLEHHIVASRNDTTSNNYALRDRLLRYQRKGREPPRIAVPTNKIKQVLRAHHEDPLAGHQGFLRTLEKIRPAFHWPTLREDVENHCKECLPCQGRKPANRNIPLQPLKPIPVKPIFDRWVMDTMGPLPETAHGNKHILVFMDHFTKWAETVPLPDLKSETIATALLTRIVCRYGAPKEILSDRGSSFMADVFQSLCRLVATRHTQSTAYHPQTNGLVERMNRTLQIMLTMYVKKQPNLWDIYLPHVTYAYNTAQHSSTGFSPFALVYGRRPQNALEQNLNKDLVELEPRPNEFVAQLRQNLRLAHEMAKAGILRAQLHQKAQYDRRNYVDAPNNRPLQRGEMVLLFNDRRKSKFEDKYIGPYKIRTINPPNAEIAELANETKVRLVHINKLKRVVGRADRVIDDADSLSDDSVEL
jgi:hypothetical protein